MGFRAILLGLFSLPLSGALSAAIPANVSFRDFFPGLRLERPVFFAEIPGKEGHYLILEQHEGQASAVFRRGDDWVKEPFVRVKVATWDEMGLLGFAFHPRFRENRKYYLHYNPDRKTSRIEERTADSSLLRDAGAAPRLVLRENQPYVNHNGGTIEFGPDGFLYIGFGDGGSGGDPGNRAQDPGTWLGKFLRIDVDRPARGQGYSAPLDNPFIGKGGYRREIWALGVRNPWKFAFHPVSGELWMGDVGQGTGQITGYEEISTVPKGGNMGWKIMEGAHCFPPETRDCKREGLVMPILELPRRDAASITGGVFFRGDPAAAFHDVYIFGDYVTGKVWGLRARNGKYVEHAEIGNVPLVSSFGTDGRGRVFAVSLSGKVFLLESPDMRPAPAAAKR